jgi:hypothetical protein
MRLEQVLREGEKELDHLVEACEAQPDRVLAVIEQLLEEGILQRREDLMITLGSGDRG